MKFRHEIKYAASPAEVYAMLADEAFRHKVYDTQGVVSATVKLTPAGDGFTMVSDLVQNTAGVPAIAKKFVGDTTQAVLTEKWKNPSGGSLEIETPGKPSSAAGTITLRPDGSGTTEVIELDLKVKVPLIGGKLESTMADNLKKEMAVEQSVGAAWLAGDR